MKLVLVHDDGHQVEVQLTVEPARAGFAVVSIPMLGGRVAKLHVGPDGRPRWAYSISIPLPEAADA